VNDWAIRTPSEHITEAGLAGSSARWIPASTVVLALAGQGKTKGTAARLEIETTCNQSMAALVPQQNLDYRFLHYWLAANYESIRSLGGGDLRDGLNLQMVGDIDIPLPPVEEQRRIADFLDDQVARIDEGIYLRSEQVRLLGEPREMSVMSKVLESHSTSDSEDLSPRERIELLSDHGWITRPLGSMYRRIKDTGHPSEPMLSVFRDAGVILKESRENLNVTAENRDIYQLIDDGWLVINRMKAWRGSVGVSQLRGIVSGHYICFAPDHQESHDYLNLLFRSPLYTSLWGSLSRGVRPGQAEIDNDWLGSVPVLIPPKDVQRAIVDEAQREMALAQTARTSVVASLEYLEERKRAVITAAVTGELDVTTARPIGVGKWVPNVGASVDSATAAQAHALSIGGIG